MPDPRYFPERELVVGGVVGLAVVTAVVIGGVRLAQHGRGRPSNQLEGEEESVEPLLAPEPPSGPQLAPPFYEPEPPDPRAGRGPKHPHDGVFPAFHVPSVQSL